MRELNSQLSRYVQHVADGGEVTITMRGTPVARMVPTDDKLENLRARGILREPTRPRGPLPEPIATRGPVSDLIGEQRA